MFRGYRFLAVVPMVVRKILYESNMVSILHYFFKYIFIAIALYVEDGIRVRFCFNDANAFKAPDAENLERSRKCRNVDRIADKRVFVYSGFVNVEHSLLRQCVYRRSQFDFEVSPGRNTFTVV